MKGLRAGQGWIIRVPKEISYREIQELEEMGYSVEVLRVMGNYLELGVIRCSS